MPLLNRGSQRPPTPAPLPGSQTGPDEVIQQLATQIPLVRVARHFWDDLQEMREWWLLLLPLLAWWGWYSYRKERRKVLRQRQQASTAQ